MRPGQIAAEQRHDPLGVAIEHGQPLAGVLDGERVFVPARRHRLPVGGQSLVPERVPVADGVDLEQILIDKPEADHPGGQPHRVRYPALARGRVDVEQLARQVTDRPVGIIRMLDHLHRVADRPLQRLDQLGRR